MTKKMFCTFAADRPTGDGHQRITISTMTPDRYGDVVVPEGADFTAYERNPIVLFGHDQHSIPVGRTEHLRVMPGKGIVAEFTWLKNDEFADRVRNAFEQKVLNAASIGFLARKAEPLSGGGMRFTEWEMLEWSVVGVPAQGEAVRVLKQLGLDSDSLKSRVLQVRDDRVITISTPTGLKEMSGADLLRAIDSVVHEQATRRFGPQVKLIRADPDDVRRLVEEAVRDTIARAGGRVD